MKESLDNKFQSILDNYINGNRGDARKGYEALSQNEKTYDFKKWLKALIMDGNTHCIDLALFLLH